MAKGAAALSVGLIARKIAPTGEPTVPPLTVDERAEYKARAEAIEAMPQTAEPEAGAPAAEGENGMRPSSGLSSGLISSGRQAYKAERQRRAELGSGSGFDLTRPELRAETVRAPQTDQPRWRGRTTAPSPMARVPVPELPDSLSPSRGIEPIAAPPERIDPPMTPMAADIAGLPGLGGAGRRKALTLRLLPEQHELLAEICQGYGCSFQGLVVSALEAYLDDLERGAVPASALVTTVTSAADYLGHHGTAPAVGEAGVHYFQLADGWRVAVWRDEAADAGRGGEYSPSEALAAAVGDAGVGELLGETAQGLGDTPLRSLAERSESNARRVALTIRLDEALHRRLQAARRRLSRTSQVILVEAIDAHLARH